MIPLRKQHIFTLLLLLLITVHSFLMNGYYSSHPQLTVATYFSSIRNQVDPELFNNSIYIQAVNRNNLRIGIFYDILPTVLTYIELETFALLHTVVSLFFMLAGIYALGHTLTRSRAVAMAATLLYTVQLNNWTLGSPAPYLNFFHHGLPYTYPMIVWSMRYFFQHRYGIAFLLTGLSFNFHPMCTLFLLFAYAVYWLINRRNFSLRLTVLCLLAFALPALPGIIKTVSHMGAGGHGELWLEGVRWVAGYTCNPSTWSPRQFVHAGLFFVLAGVSLFAFPVQSVRRTIMIFWLAVAFMCLIGTIFADIIPVPFIIKLSLWRSTVIYLYLGIILIAWACMHIGRRSRMHALLAVSLMTLLTGYLPQLPQIYLAVLLPVFIYALAGPQNPTGIKRCALFAGTTLGLLSIYALITRAGGFWLVCFLAAALLCISLSFSAVLRGAQALLLWAAAVIIFDIAVLTAQGGPKIYYHGRLQGTPDPWAQVQLAAREVSNIDDLFIVPPFCNDFYHYSLRAVLGDWAEGSTLLYLDNRFTEEWFERMHALGWTQPHNAREGFNNLTTEEITQAGNTYNAAFVVTEKPKEFALPQVYENSRFILYRLPASSDQ